MMFMGWWLVRESSYPVGDDRWMGESRNPELNQPGLDGMMEGFWRWLKWSVSKVGIPDQFAVWQSVTKGIVRHENAKPIYKTPKNTEWKAQRTVPHLEVQQPIQKKRSENASKKLWVFTKALSSKRKECGQVEYEKESGTFSSVQGSMTISPYLTVICRPKSLRCSFTCSFQMAARASGFSEA